jgi:hypothetical protein
MPGDKPEKSKHPLDSRKGEKSFMHRAFMLWAMQDERCRSGHSVANAMSRGESTVRGWKKKYDWEERVDEAGPAVQQQAIQRYRTRYMHRYGNRELMHVEKRMSVPVLPDEPAPTEDGDSEGQKLADQHALDRDENRRAASRHLKIVDAAIGTIIGPLKEGKLKLTLRDLPHFIKLRQEMADRLAPPVTKDARGVLIESARVQIAKASGGDVVEAMYEDAQELVAILGAMSAKNQPSQAGEVIELDAASGGSG